MRKTYVKIEANREGYAPDQLGQTMTVGQLIELLRSFDEYMEVILSHDNGYTYGSISEWDFDVWEDDASDDDEEDWEDEDDDEEEDDD